MEYKKSRFFHVFRGMDNRACCFNSLTIKRVYSDIQTAGKVDSFIGRDVSKNELEENDFIKQLIEKRMLVPIDFDEDLMIEKIRSEIFRGVNIRVMVLHLTDFCNLRCKYCFIEGGQPKGYERQMMSEEIARQAVDKFIDIIRKRNTIPNKPSIVFYGGEPLLNWDVLRNCIEYISYREETEKIHIDKVIITNGTLIESKMIDTIKKHNVLVSISVDGVKDLHDCNRVDQNNKGSHDLAIKGIRLLKENGIEPAVSCVMAKEGVHRNVETLEYLVNELEVKGIGFNHVSIIPGLNYYDQEYEEAFADAVIEVQSIIQKKYPYVYERRMGHKVNTFIDEKLIKSDCTGCGEQISVSPDGFIGICQGYMGSRKTFRHSVFERDYYPEDDDIFIEWSKRSPLNIDKCLDCPALATCGGGCPRNADMINGSIWEVDSAFCHFAIKSLRWLVWQTIEGGTWN